MVRGLWRKDDRDKDTIKTGAPPKRKEGNANISTGVKNENNNNIY